MATKEYISELLQTRKIRPNWSLYGAPLSLVNQKEKLRGVIDYRALNRFTKPNHAPIHKTDKMFDRIVQAKYFSKPDLETSMHQIRICPENIEKTAFKTIYAHFEFLVMPMSICNASATFQGLMNSIFNDHIDGFIVTYLDDILIFINFKEEHLRHLLSVHRRL